MRLHRRQFLLTAAGLSLTRAARSAGADAKFVLHTWKRDARNPIFKPEAAYDAQGCQGPFVIQRDDTYSMFYAGIGRDGIQRICLATAPVERPTEWRRHGPIIELGGKDTFDERSHTYPCVHRIGTRWHLYYTGRSNQSGPQHFASYRGIGLAVSDDLRNWKKHSSDAVLTGDGYPGFPENKVIVGLGRIIELRQQDGRTLYRMYHTLPPGLKSKEWHVIEDKYAVVAHSFDGLHWSDKKVVLARRRDVPYEDIGVVGLTAWKTQQGYRGIYTGLGTQFKSYALCEAISADGLTWQRGEPGQNLAMAPAKQGWESNMIGYPCIVEEADTIRLFYNGTGGGATGIGMASAARL